MDERYNIDGICRVLQINELRLDGLMREGAIPRPRLVDGQTVWLSSDLKNCSFITEPENWTIIRPPPSARRVYFVEAGAYIKIGYSARLDRRLLDLETGCPEKIVLLYDEPGDYNLEAYYHAKFAHLRVKGEWFRKEPELLACIDYLQVWGREPP